MPKLKLITLAALTSFGCADECNNDEVVVGICRSCEIQLEETTTAVPSRVDYSLEGNCAASITALDITEEAGSDIFNIVNRVFPGETDDIVGSFGLEAVAAESGEFSALLVISNSKADDEVHPIKITVTP